MKQKFSSFFLTLLLGLSGMQAWALDKDSNGLYQIGTAQDLADFAALVNGGDTYINAELTADIDYTGQNVQIGGSYYGHFNGNGHTVTYAFSGGTVKGVKAALFFNLYGTVENLKVAGTIDHALDNAGGISYCNYGIIRNCISDVDFTLTKDGSCSCGGISGMAGANSIIEKCAFTGSFDKGTASTKNVAGIVGWSSNGAIIRDCLVIASSNISVFQTTHRGTATVSNCFYMKDGGSADFTVNSGSTETTSADLASGKTAYQLGVTQNIGSETIPNVLGTSSRVYAVGSCNGATATSFTNDASAAKQHTFSGFVCTTCGAAKKAPDCSYEIGSAQDLVAFAALVNGSETNAKAVLTADIDMDGVTIDPIGAVDKRYTGEFDGQGHTISKLTITQTAANTGLFNTGANVVLRDFFLDSTCTITGQAQTGVIGNHSGKNGLFEKIGSAAKIVSTGGGNVGGLIGGCWCGKPGVVTVNACWTIGSITSSGDNQNNNGQFIGWSNDGTLNFSYCWSTATMNHWESYANYWARFRGTLNFTNCYSTLGTQVPNIVSADVTSGRLCFLLNSGTESPVWFQTLNSDKTPVLDSTHGMVYATYNTDCDGATLTAGTLGYSNTATSGMTGQPMRDHNYVDGVCTQCGQTQADANNYTISTADQLRHFACGVAAGNRAINATLAADINMADLGEVEMPIIGEGDNYFSGIFDGKGHAIHNYKLTSDKEYAGFIGYLYGSTVKDFSIDGEMTLSATNAGGLIGRTNSVCTISDVHSTINITAAGSADDRLGGIIGYANGSKTTVTRCSYGGTMTIPSTFGHSAGGIIGGGYNILDINACVFYGKVNATGTGKATNFGGMIGYFNSTVATGIANCLAAGIVETEEGREFTNLRGILASQSGSQSHDIYSIITNCYYTDLDAEVATATPEDAKVGSATPVTAEKMARGEIAYTLNGNQSGGTWTQTLGTQCAPLPISSGDKVYPYAKSGDNQYFVNKTSAPVVPVMTLTDGADFTAEGNFTATRLSCNRTLYKGYNSVCMPFAINTDMLGEGSKIFTVATVGTEDVTLEETTEAAAGQPCIVSVTADCTPFTALTGVTMTSAPDNSGSMKGSFTLLTIGAGKYKLSSDGSYFGQTSEGAIVGAFRSYIDAPSSVKTLNIVLEGTGIEEVSENGASKAQTIYDLSGRRVNNATKGIYIINGKKILK